MTLDDLIADLPPTTDRRIVFVTGAGVSVASGIPTFRGPEGYWTVGTRDYRPQELATLAAYQKMPREVWRWYLYRKGVCNGADPNPAHRSLARLEEHLGDHFTLITQNVDGLHTRGGCTPERTLEVHGSIDWMRDETTDALVRIPDDLALHGRDEPLDAAAWDCLVNPQTGARCRPHVLWFDEYYDEVNYRAQSAMTAAGTASLIVVCGTSGAASLPFRALEVALEAGAAVVDISPDDNPFREVAAAHPRGVILDATAVDGFAQLADALIA